MTPLNDLDLRQLEAFSAVISAGSVTAAAKALNRSQPAVSRLIQELEQSLGYPLFIRNGPRIHPSEEALQLHQYVQKALLSLQQIRLRAQEIAHQQHRPLSIAATPALAPGYCRRHWPHSIYRTKCKSSVSLPYRRHMR